MACSQEILVLISCYADGETTPEETIQAKEHLATCSDCRKLVEEWQRERQLLEWAYTFELPEQIVVDASRQASRGGKQMSVVQKSPSRALRQRISWRFNWKKVGAWAAAASIVAFVIYYLAILPPTLGRSLSTTSSAEKVRVALGISLEVGPDSKIDRVDGHTIRLTKGEITASVVHGTGFRILTNRIEVLDRGTEFSVISGAKGDCVAVQEGKVTVKSSKFSCDVRAGSVLTAEDGSEPSVGSIPLDNSERGDDGLPLDRKEPKISPKSDDDLVVDEGFQRLASRFPDARQGGLGMCRAGSGEKRWLFMPGTAVRLRNNLREHFVDIAQAYAGGETSSDWEMPAFYLYVYGITQPVELPKDMYYIRLASERGKLIWKISGGYGTDVEIPAEFRNLNDNYSIGGSEGYDKSLDYSFKHNDDGGWLTMRLRDWPGDKKPALYLELAWLPVNVAEKARFDAFNKASGQISGISGITLDRDESTSTLLYLDTKRRHQVYVAWNTEAGNQLDTLQKNVQRGGSGSVVLGVMTTDVPLEEPKAKPGTYLISLFMGRSKAPSIELLNVDQKRIASCAASVTGDPGGIQYTFNADGLGARLERMRFSFYAGREDQGLFPLQIQVLGRPDDKPTDQAPSKPWAIGWIKIKKP